MPARSHRSSFFINSTKNYSFLISQYLRSEDLYMLSLHFLYLPHFQQTRKNCTALQVVPAKRTRQRCTKELSPEYCWASMTTVKTHSNFTGQEKMNGSVCFGSLAGFNFPSENHFSDCSGNRKFLVFRFFPDFPISTFSDRISVFSDRKMLLVIENYKISEEKLKILQHFV